MLFSHEWVLSKSPAGAHQWIPADPAAASLVPDPHDQTKRHPPVMLTTDLALRVDPAYEPICRRFHANQEAFAEAFARAWFKLTHRDMGPISRYLGPEVPTEALSWQDPLPPRVHDLVDDRDIEMLRATLLSSTLSIPDMVTTAWASAVTFRGSDKRGGANGARLRLAPQKDWEVNDPQCLARVLGEYDRIREAFNDGRPAGGRRVSLADLIVLGGCVAIEEAARRAGHDVNVPFHAGRTDASQEQTDVDSFAFLEPITDGFRNHAPSTEAGRAEHSLVEQAHRLTLTAAEMTVLVGGMRVLDANLRQSPRGVLTRRAGMLTNDFFTNLLDMRLVWSPSGSAPGAYEGRDRTSGTLEWTASRVDLVFGSDASLRAIAEVYASADGEGTFVRDFVAAWARVMDLDRFDLHQPAG
jgi:catalase-peroxidase